jgi:SAM-dependent methyltransferase
VTSPADRQRDYYDRAPDRSRIVPNARAATLRHLERALAALAAARVRAPARVLDLGAGMGRFSFLLADRGYDVTALDVSGELLARLRAGDPDRRIATHLGDATEAHHAFAQPFDAVVGFFFLHHFDDVSPVFRAVHALLRPGGRAVFCEPNSWNPSFYLQVLLSRTMTFRGEAGLTRMRYGPLARAAAAAELTLHPLERYGLLPPVIADHPTGAALDRALAAGTPPILRAFQTVVVERPS